MEVDGVESWVNIGLYPRDDVYLNEQHEDRNQSLNHKQTINYLHLSLWHGEECATWDENDLSGIGHNDLPEVGIVIESNIE